MCQWNSSSSLVQSGNKPLPKPMITYCQYDHEEKISVKFSQATNIIIDENTLFSFM